MVPFSLLGQVMFYTFTSDYIGELEGDAGFILGLSTYYNKSNKRTYALISNSKGIFAYIIDGLKLYKKFIPKVKETDKTGFDEAYIIEKDIKLILIGPRFYYGYIYFWDFKKGDLIKTMTLISGISDICLWDNNYIFASLTSSNSQFVLINCNSKEIEKIFLLIKMIQRM